MIIKQCKRHQKENSERCKEENKPAKYSHNWRGGIVTGCLITSHPTEEGSPGLVFPDHQASNIREPRMEQGSCWQHQVGLIQPSRALYRDPHGQVSRGSITPLAGPGSSHLLRDTEQPWSPDKGHSATGVSDLEVFITMGRGLSSPNLEVPGDSSWGKLLSPKVTPSRTTLSSSSTR